MNEEANTNRVPTNRFACKGISFQLPADWKIRMPLPNMLAVSKDKKIYVSVEIDPDEVSWQAMEDIVSRPLGVNPALDSKVIRQGPTSSPCPGKELIVEHIVIDTGAASCLWQRNLVGQAVRLILNMNGHSSFADCECTFVNICESVRIEVP